MQLVGKKIIKIYQKNISQLRKDLGRSITVHMSPTRTLCNNCNYDSQRGESTGVYNGTGAFSFSMGTHCPVCDNKGKLEVADIRTINNVTVKWIDTTSINNQNYEFKIGQGEPGWVRLSVDLSLVLIDKTNLNGDTIFNTCEKVVVDNEDCNVKNVVKKGLKTLYTCRVYLRKKSLDKIT